MAEKINLIIVQVGTGSDGKEDSQFELIVRQGVVEIEHLSEGAGEDWDEGDFREFINEHDVDVTGESISVYAALQDGDYGRSNHWNVDIKVLIRTTEGRQLTFQRYCAFRTRASRRRHEIYFGSQNWGSHATRIG
jgi:hypothetical protein